MAQTVLLGLGGTGAKVVNNVVKDLQSRNIGYNDGTICCAVMDTNANDNKKIEATGTHIPVVHTGKNREIGEYMRMYANSGVMSWLPDSPAFRRETIIDGASQMRVKSRLAMMDCIADRTLLELERLLDSLFDNRDQAKIRVMIVSSLAGGTGSGMFIQTALWVRRFFAGRNCRVTIRGIFLLPDVFIRTIGDTRRDNTEIRSLYSNAYGSIRELNAITKIKTGKTVPQRPVRLDGLFDSERDVDGLPVYDYAFFVDDVSEGGSVLKTIEEYEQTIARLVYMQLYAPMHDDLYSEEDNLFKRFQLSTEPVFGACGTAKAMYPKKDVLQFCALTAAKDALSNGWRVIDLEIAARQEREEEQNRQGTIPTHQINPRAEYMRQFEQRSSRTGDEVGRDRLFALIAHDIQNEERVPGQDGEVEIVYTDKVDDFLSRLEERLAATIDTTDPAGLKALRLQKTWQDQTGDTAESLISDVEKKVRAVENFLNGMDQAVDSLAAHVVDMLCPVDMGDINPDNADSVYGLLTKKDTNEQTFFVHPLAARHLLYKLAANLEEIKNSLMTDKTRDCAKRGYGRGKKKISFDNPRTRAVEEDAIAYLRSRAFLQNESHFIKLFKDRYSQHNEGQAQLCRTYAIELLKQKVVILLSARLELLIKETERFFQKLEDVHTRLEEDLAANCRKNEAPSCKTIYVYATAAEKASIYASLHFDTADSNVEINRIIAESLYGCFCAQERPNAKNNTAYVGRDVATMFYGKAVATYRTKLDKENHDDIDLDIYTAVCKSSDFAEARRRANEERDDVDPLGTIDWETGEQVVDNAAHARHIAAMQELVRSVHALGAPMLICSPELPEDVDEHLADDRDYVDLEYYTNDFVPIRKNKTFWGFHPSVANSCPELGVILGVNVSSQAHAKYLKNELDCYRAVYGVQAYYVDKFNELKNGAYYSNYCAVVNCMTRELAEGRSEGLIHTPHLDKTWHEFLPYVTPQMQQEEERRFYRLFWLAVAYGKLRLEKDAYQIERIRTTEAGGEYTAFEALKHGGRSIGKADVPKLLTTLKQDTAFLKMAARLEQKFRDECEHIDTYESTEFLRGKLSRALDAQERVIVGGVAAQSDTNAVTLIVRYHNSPSHDDGVTAVLVQTLEALCCELVKGNYEQDEQEKVRSVSYELCRRIYQASAMERKNIDMLQHWSEAWGEQE